MATFQVSKKNKKKSSKNIKSILGWVLIGVSTFVFLFSATNLLPFLHNFFLGCFGIFVYPLTILGFIIALALLNNKKYVMPKRYAIFLALSLYFFLCIIQLIIVGPPAALTYGKYLALNYSKKITAGGILIGFLPCSLAMLTGLVTTYILLSISLIVCLVFFVEAIISLRKSAEVEKPIKLQIKEEIVNKNPREEIIGGNPKVSKKKEEINVMYQANVAEEEKRELTAKEKLGLVGGYKQQVSQPYQPKEIKLPEEKQDEHLGGMTLREYLLSPPKVDMDKFKEQQTLFSNRNLSRMPIAREETVENKIEETQTRIDSLKEDQLVQESHSSLPQVQPEELTSEAEDIIRSVVMQEKQEREAEDNKEFIDFEDVETPQQEEEQFSDTLPYENHDDEIKLDSNREELLSRNRFDRGFDRQEQPKPFMREKPNDEMERRKRFVSLDEEPKKEEKIVPYKYKRPSLDLITTVSDDPATFNQDMPLKRIALENALENFGVPAKVQNVVVGPTVTRYEIEMPEGISVKKVLSLDADIAYALSANGQIRIEAPIPGRSMVGIEVPNTKVAKVSVKDVLASKEFTLSPSALTFALGKDITGNVKVCNLQKMPHLLVAGTTGSGKSVCLNTIITSLLYKSSPDEVKFIMIDPKQVELSMYEGLPHMVVPKVITDPNKAVNALQWAVDEMERRFKLISEERVRNIDEYNKTDKVLQNKIRKMPYIVIIFDEFADFMAVAKNEIEDKIRRLAGKARAAGIHLILATQRPSTDVVTGTLKANLPARIAFKVAGRVDSEVILGAPGAEKLLGWGDMLYKPADSSPQRLQGCLIETQETKDIVNFIIDNNEEIYDEEAVNAINNPGKSSNSNGGDNNGVDPLLPQALKICIDNGVASTTMVQRKLSIGYPRAARIVDQMEERGYIASAEGSKQRAVYITIEEFYSIFGDIYD